MMSRRVQYESAIKSYTNNTFDDATGSGLPDDVNLCIDMLMQSDNNRPAGISSKTQGDMVVASYTTEEWPPNVKIILKKYRKIAWL